MGARMVGILDVPPIGCTPGSRVGMPDDACNDGANSLAQGFNNLLRMQLANAVAANMKELKYSIASNYHILSEMMANPFIAGTCTHHINQFSQSFVIISYTSDLIPRGRYGRRCLKPMSPHIITGKKNCNTSVDELIYLS